MTDDGNPALQTAQERELNQQLEFDNDDWESTATTQPGTPGSSSSDEDEMMVERVLGEHSWVSPLSPQCVRPKAPSSLGGDTFMLACGFSVDGRSGLR